MWLSRVIRGLRSRGVAWSADRILSIVQERLFDLRYGTDTVSFVPLETLTIAGRNVSEGTQYEPTRLRLVRRVLSSLDGPSDGAFVDFGCGKGRVLLLAAHYGFRRITGVEFAKELCHVARCNWNRYRNKTGVQADVRVVEEDAMEYKIQDDEAFFYMSNPFSATLVEKVAENIMRALTSKPRQGYIIYNNPLWGDAIQRQGFFPVRDFNAGECIVYGNKKDKSP
jgi:predicted RNA methylase